MFVSSVLGIFYTISMTYYFVGINTNISGTTESIGSAIATALVLPHLFAVAIATIFNILAFFMNGSGFAIASGVIYCVGAFLFLLYSPFILPMIILSFIGVSKIKKINNLMKLSI